MSPVKCPPSGRVARAALVSGGDEAGDRGGVPPGRGGARRGAGRGGGREDPTLGSSWMPVRAVPLRALHPKEYSTRLT